MGLGGIKTGNKNVYPKPYTPHSFGIFFDPRNELFNFVGEEVAGLISGVDSLLPGTQLNTPYKQPNTAITLNNIVNNSSIFEQEEKIIGILKSNGAKKPFFDSTKFSTKWSGQSINKIYNSNTTFKYPVTTENVKYGGGFGVSALSFMKSKGNIYSDGNTKPAQMIDGYSTPLNNKFPIGTQNYNQIQFPSGSSKYPAPLIQSNKTLTDIVQSGTKWSFPVNDNKFGK